MAGSPQEHNPDQDSAGDGILIDRVSHTKDVFDLIKCSFLAQLDNIDIHLFNINRMTSMELHSSPDMMTH